MLNEEKSQAGLNLGLPAGIPLVSGLSGGQSASPLEPVCPCEVTRIPSPR